MQLQEIITNPIVVAALVNVSAVVAISTLSPIFQSKRDNKRWEREKLYDLHLEAYEALTDLLKSVSTANHKPGNEMPAFFYTSTGALNRLKLAYSGEQAETILSVETALRSLYKGSMIQTKELEDLEKLRQQVLAIAQSDPRLKDLFK